jgi:hypothetical protein
VTFLAVLIRCLTCFAEALREQKRREYVQKQKQKLAQYQSKVKSEAEKIQVIRTVNLRTSTIEVIYPTPRFLFVPHRS